jgi:protease-4
VFAIKGLEKGFGGEDDETTEEIKKEGVLKLELSGELVERVNKGDPFQNISVPYVNENKNVIGLNVLRKIFEKAAQNEKVKGVLLEIKGLSGGMASFEEFRSILEDFKKKTEGKKWIWSYAEIYGQKEYYLASACDRIFLHPQGGMMWQGLNATVLFYKELFNKLGIEVQIFRHGKFKSAVEPFMLDKMSNENRLQFESILNNLWNHITEQIGQSRKISPSDLNEMANQLMVKSPEDAQKLGLVDELAYWDEVESNIRKQVGIKDEKEKIHFIKESALEKWKNSDEKISKDKIAVIYAVGSIESGEGDNETIGSETIGSAIRKAADDEKVKAIVFRVNSPGGSALASDVIWREVVRAKKKKPFIVSMGDVAASGGYYISCAADKIFARPNTITGSIGVFGMMANVSRLLKEKLGIYADTVNTNQYSDLGTMYRSYSQKEKDFIQSSVEKVYDVFITRVAEGRGMQKNMVDSIGQGRVWSGTEGKKIGLVDEFGGLQDAIQEAAKRAKVEEYNLVEYPKMKSPFDEFFKSGVTQDETALLLKTVRDNTFQRACKQLKTFFLSPGRNHVWMMLPYEIIF